MSGPEWLVGTAADAVQASLCCACGMFSTSYKEERTTKEFLKKEKKKKESRLTLSCCQKFSSSPTWTHRLALQRSADVARCPQDKKMLVASASDHKRDSFVGFILLCRLQARKRQLSAARRQKTKKEETQCTKRQGYKEWITWRQHIYTTNLSLFFFCIVKA